MSNRPSAVWATVGSSTRVAEPFFLYLPMTSPHTLLSVNKPFIGRSDMNNLYADLTIETDDKVLRDNGFCANRRRPTVCLPS